MKLVIALTTLAFATAAASADVVTWADWTGSTGPGVGTVTGNIGAMTVTYSGEIDDTTQINNTGIDYWHSSGATPFPAYISAQVSNAPSTVDLIAITGTENQPQGVLNTVTFGSPVTNPYMAIVSLGRTSIDTTYYFDQPFNIISVGEGYWGDGTLANLGPNGLGGETLQGLEGHGVIQFIGTFTTLSWTSSSGEYWNGFTFGVTPTPGAAAVLGLGGLTALRRRR